METELGPEILHLVEVAIVDIDDDMGESEVSALSDFSDDSDSTYNDDEINDEIDDVIGDNDSHVTARGRREHMARIRIHDAIANFTGVVGHEEAFPTIDTTIERGKVCNCLDFGLDMCCQDMAPPFSFFRVDWEEEMQFPRNEDVRGNNLNRKRLYRECFHALDFGLVEPGERRRLPYCVEAKVRQCFPEENGLYMGYKEH